MAFKNPDFLYFLFLLVIPIIVHLFQLRKFKKTPFTNVRFLKKVVVQTRKSSQLKKWLTLLARCLALACIVLAFAQPFVPKSDAAVKPVETVIYLDNSFSMQLEGQRGELMKRAIQELLEKLPPEKEITLITNDEVYRNSTVSQLKKELLQLDYASIPVSFNTILLRAQNEFEEGQGTRKQLIAISDFQQNSVELEKISLENIELSLVQLKPVNTANVSIDSLYISEKGIDKLTVKVLLSYMGEKPEVTSVSLYDDKKPIAKTSAEFGEDLPALPTGRQADQAGKKAVVNLNLNNTGETIKGKVTVEDRGLAYDNVLFFSINPTEKIKVIALGISEDNFLKRIYKPENFDFKAFPEGEIDYNQLTDANAIVLNGLEEIPMNLVPILKNLIENGGHLAIVPSKKIDLQNYRNLLAQLSAPIFSKSVENEKTITKIVFSHPLFEGVFDKKVENFQYPEVRSYFDIEGFAQPVLQYADGSPFLVRDGNVYLFTASLDLENSNFKNSPLVVPVFYNIAKQSLKSPELYYPIGQKTTYDIPVELEKDQILSIENLPAGEAGQEFSFIPQQRSFDNKTQITTTGFPEKSGIYQIVKDGKTIQHVSYNHTRTESDLHYANVSQLEGISIGDNVGEFLAKQQEQNEIDELWKWFVIFAVFFLVMEVLLLRFLK